MDSHELLRQSGIYRLDFPSGHFYIGQSVSVIKRWRTHRSSFKNGQTEKHQRKMFNVWRKHGEPAFTVLAYCEVDELTRIEQHLISHYWADYKFVNTNPDAQTSRGVKRTHVAWQKGKTFTAEHRRRLSEARRRRKGTAMYNAKLTEAQVAEIRERYSKQKKGCGSTTLAKEYGVSYRTILYIVNNQRYVDTV